MEVYRKVPLTGTAPVVNAISWPGQKFVATNASRSQTNFLTVTTSAPWQPEGAFKDAKCCR
jgi:hypothetical protein